MPKKKKVNVIEIGKNVLKIEAEAVRSLIKCVDKTFQKVVEELAACQGRVIVTAIGKSGYVGRKIAATLTSTGTPAIFLHPAEGFHGDLGIIRPQDIVLAISNSGETEEIINLLPIIEKMGVKIIALTGNKNSTLAKHSDLVLHINVKKEADQFNLIPTASTTATLAIGDAIAVALLSKKDFKVKDFLNLHPGGGLGKSYLEVEQIMHKGDANPVIHKNKTFKEALLEITSKGLGAISVVDDNGVIIGIITDGDIRRLFMRADEDLSKIFSWTVGQVMKPNPVVVHPYTLCTDALRLMEQKAITVLPVINDRRQPIGMVHLHDLVKRGFSLV